MSTPAEMLGIAGERLETGANHPIWLDDPDTAWLVESGGVDVFSVAYEPAGPVGLREHLYHFHLSPYHVFQWMLAAVPGKRHRQT